VIANAWGVTDAVAKVIGSAPSAAACFGL